MPELPEVEVIRLGLLPRVVGRRIRAARITAPRLTRRAGSPAEVQAGLVGRRVETLRRRGKFLLFGLGGSTLVVRLGMTGQLLWADDARQLPADRHVHAHLRFAGGGTLAYRDPRKFGEMFLLPSDAVEGEIRVGVEPLGSGFTLPALRAICRSPTRIKTVLLDQRRIAGIGNIYADEALFRAGIRPTRSAASLTGGEVAALRVAIRRVLQAGIRHRGSSIADYRDAEGQPGRFARLHRVYHRTGAPCLVCGAAVSRILLGQRGTHFCPRCQQ
jgi:formamidopyrimidine-DNA glycosylase